MKVARFQSHYSVKSQAYNLDTVLREIARGETSVITADAVAVSAGGNTLKHATEHARRLLVAGNKQAYDGIKQALPAVVFRAFRQNGLAKLIRCPGWWSANLIMLTIRRTGCRLSHRIRMSGLRLSRWVVRVSR